MVKQENANISNLRKIAKLVDFHIIPLRISVRPLGTDTKPPYDSTAPSMRKNTIRDIVILITFPTRLISSLNGSNSRDTNHSKGLFIASAINDDIYIDI